MSCNGLICGRPCHTRVNIHVRVSFEQRVIEELHHGSLFTYLKIRYSISSMAEYSAHSVTDKVKTRLGYEHIVFESLEI